MPAMTAATATLWRREMVRFFRQRSRVLGALATPILFYAVLGFGLDEAFRSATTDGEHRLGYLAYFFTGVVVMILLFTAIFSTITVILRDRKFTTFDYASLIRAAQDAVERLRHGAHEMQQFSEAMESAVGRFCIGLARAP